MARKPLPKNWRHQVLAAARSRAIGTIEIGANAGQIVEDSQHFTGNRPPDFYCMSGATRAFERGVGHTSPLLSTGACEQQRSRAIRLGALRTRAQFDAALAHDPLSVAAWLFLCVYPAWDPKTGKVVPVGTPGAVKHAHHTGLVGMLDADTGEILVRGQHGGFYVIEFNAADPKKPASRNGDGAYEGRERGASTDATLYEFIDPSAYPL